MYYSEIYQDHKTKFIEDTHFCCMTPNAGDWDLPRWGNAVAGECGEMCNIIKKIDRGDFNDNPEAGKEALEKEIADVLIYLDLLANKAGLDLQTSVVNKFNEKSEEIGSNIKIYYY